MKNSVILIVVLSVLISCSDTTKTEKQQPKKTVETSQQLDSLPKKTAVITVDETGFEPFDASEYLSTQLLLGRGETLKKQKIENLHIVGENTYKINHQGLIIGLYNISNNYSEYTYTKSGF